MAVSATSETMRLGLLTLMMVMVMVMAATPDPLAGERWRHRLVVVFADRADDARLARQRELLASDTAALALRDVRLIEIFPGASPPDIDAGAARAALGVPHGFAVLLIGKDGGTKLRAAAPIEAARLMTTIDAMPMARDEMRRHLAP